jgi:hypothetical protein
LKKFLFLSLAASIFFCCFLPFEKLNAQMVTGVWHGKINRQKVELKIIQNGDSLTGTSYYYISPANYRRYTIKGYFDQNTNETVWWDDELLESSKGKKLTGTPGMIAMQSHADFNCPGGGVMKLDGKTASKENEEKSIGTVHLDKTNSTVFNDEWDYVIENYTLGANDPFIIDSVSMIAFRPKPIPEAIPVVVKDPTPEPSPVTHAVPKPEPVETVSTTTPAAPLTIEQKFAQRKKVPVLEIPVSGDSITLNFYDNAEIDGDSITLFLNDKLIFQHIFLTDKPFVVKIPVNELEENNELVMVAENMGSIPPNTSLMIAYIEGKRYEARLVSTEGSSAMIRFVKKITNPDASPGE